MKTRIGRMTRLVLLACMLFMILRANAVESDRTSASGRVATPRMRQPHICSYEHKLGHHRGHYRHCTKDEKRKLAYRLKKND